MLSGVSAGERGMVVWGELVGEGGGLQEVVELLQAQVGAQPRVAVENSERVHLAGHRHSSFHAIYSGCAGLATIAHSPPCSPPSPPCWCPGGGSPPPKRSPPPPPPPPRLPHLHAGASRPTLPLRPHPSPPHLLCRDKHQ